RNKLSDIGILLFLAGSVQSGISVLLSDRQNGFAEMRYFLQYWSARLVLLGVIAFAPFGAWLSVADLVGQPLQRSFPTSLPPAANWAMFVALCLALLGMVLVLPELLWRSWRERRAARAARR